VSKRLTEAIVNRRALAGAGLVLAVALAVLGALGLRIDMSSQAFYAADGDDAAALHEFTARWGPDDDWLIAVVQRSPQRPGRVTDAAQIRQLRRLQTRIEAVEGVASTWSIASLPIALGDASPGVIPRALVLQRLVAARVVSAAQDATVIVVQLQRSSDDALAIAEIVDDVRSATEESSDPGLTVSLAGVPAVRAAFVRLAISDQMWLQPLVYAVMALGLWIAFRRLHAVVVPLVASAVPVVLLVGLLGAVGEPVGLLNQALMTLLPVIAVADAVHWVSRFHERLRAQPGPHDAASRRRALSETGATVGRACRWTSITTAVGLLSLAVSDMPILRGFAVWGALGVGLAWLSVAVVLPLGLSWSRAEPRPARGVADGGTPFVTRHARAVLLLGAVIGAGATFAAARGQVDNRLSDLLDPSHPVAVATAQVDDELTGSLTLEIEAVGSPGTWPAEDARAALQTLRAWAERQPEVRTTLGPPPAATEGSPGLPSGAWWPSQTWRPEVAAGRLRVLVADDGGRAFEALAQRAQAQLPALPGVTFRITGTALLAYRGVNRITGDLRLGVAGMLVVIALVVAGLFRRLDWALASLLVNAWPLAVGLAVVSLVGGPLDPLAVVVITVGVGLAVDDTIHLLLRAQEEGGDEAAVARAVVTTGRAVITTSLVLAAGLGLNLLSSFPPLRTLGALGALVILAALAADLWLLPALVAVFARRRAP
jgi:predicted RND superfamily exporter protein